MVENDAYLRQQVITYIGNKRALLPLILEAVAQVRAELGGRKLRCADLFSGSGIVARGLRQHADLLVANDLEGYCATLSRCYLSSSADRDAEALSALYAQLKQALEGPLDSGFIARLYAPQDAENIQPHERAFYTPRNARYIDTARRLIGQLPEQVQPYFLAPLLFEASVKANTAGVFKGFYKNPSTHVGQFGGGGRDALSRICADIDLPFPVFSSFDCETHILRADANSLAGTLPPLDLVYLDPPYNQHPYGSNYFMLNLIDTYREPGDISAVSGIPKDWNRSPYNKARQALPEFLSLCAALNSRFLLISMNSEGFMPRDALAEALARLGRLTVVEQQYNTFRGSRNLKNRSIHTKEYLFLLKKAL